MIKKKDLLITTYLRQNARETLTNLSKRVHMPISTVYEKLRTNQDGLIKKHTCLMDFSKIGFHARAQVFLKTKREDRDALGQQLQKLVQTNTLYKINNGYDYLVELVCRDLQEMEIVLEQLDQKFSFSEKEVFFVIDELKREAFLTQPEMIDRIWEGGKHLNIRPSKSRNNSYL
ncbi:Lrp/AsnC family transcriptional regulator [Candidatus Woesearchaeota archaeon]|nr:Lrp/AsnC family transcriptional regulator [Candidatus Woesearchaeota archaeon]